MPSPIRLPDTVFQAVIEPAGLHFEAPASMPLLQAAALAGIRMPRSCQTGTCRACLCRLLSGRVRYAVEWPGLLPEEFAEGALLPCVAHPVSAIVIEAPQARMS